CNPANVSLLFASGRRPSNSLRRNGFQPGIGSAFPAFVKIALQNSEGKGIRQPSPTADPAILLFHRLIRLRAGWTLGPAAKPVPIDVASLSWCRLTRAGCEPLPD